MRRILILYIIFSVIGLTTVHAQFDNGRQRVDENGYDQYGNQVDPAMIPDRLDSANVEVQGLPPKLYMWRINNQLGDRTIIPADTAYHHFQNSNLTEGLTGHYNYLANMGSPRMSRIFFERRDPEPTIFMEPFSSFFIRPTEFNFTNSNVPYTNLTYHKAGNKINGEERFKSYFSVNVNKKLAFGFNNVFFFSKFKTITSSQPQLVIAPHVESQQARVVEHLCIGKKRLFACGIFRQLQGECRITHNLVFENIVCRILSIEGSKEVKVRAVFLRTCVFVINIDYVFKTDGIVILKASTILRSHFFLAASHCHQQCHGNNTKPFHTICPILFFYLNQDCRIVVIALLFAHEIINIKNVGKRLFIHHP